MTIAVVWQEDGFQWCAADTRLVAGGDRPTTEIAAKIYVIPVVVRALDKHPLNRQPHYWRQYGFVYAGSASPASMTAVTISTLLQKLAGPSDRAAPPKVEEIAQFVRRIAERFMKESRRFGNDGIFSAALLGWCPLEMTYKLAHIEGRDDSGSFRVEVYYPPPRMDGDPWLVLGSGDKTFYSTLAEYRKTEQHITKRVIRRVIDKMVSEERDPTVGGATSLGMANQGGGFELFWSLEPIIHGQPAARRIFQGLDLDTEIGQLGQYHVDFMGLA